MAYDNRASALFLVAVVLFAASPNPTAHGQSVTLGGLAVSGSLCCNPTGNCPGQGVSGVPVRLNCTLVGGNSAVIGNGTTNADGTFNITVPAITGLLLGLPFVPCVITAQLPLSNAVCPALNSTTGILASAIRTGGTVINSVFGTVQNGSLVGFVTVTP